MPIKQIFKKKKLFFEKYVTLSKNKIEFLYKKADKNLIQRIKKLNLIFEENFTEYPIEAIKFIMEQKNIKRTELEKILGSKSRV